MNEMYIPNDRPESEAERAERIAQDTEPLEDMALTGLEEIYNASIWGDGNSHLNRNDGPFRNQHIKGLQAVYEAGKKSKARSVDQP